MNMCQFYKMLMERFLDRAEFFSPESMLLEEMMQTFVDGFSEFVGHHIVFKDGTIYDPIAFMDEREKAKA
jgi:hypothetical protein